MYSQKTGIKLKKIEKALLPFEFDTKMIVEALKSSDNRNIYTLKKRLDPDKVEAEASKLDVLKITGKEFSQSLSPERPRIKSYTKNVKSIKLALDQPIDQIFGIISSDPDSKHYQKELFQLQKFVQSPKKRGITESNPNFVNSEVNFFSTNIPKQQKGISVHAKDTEDQQSLQYYERMIVSNPILYRKIIMAYKSSQRQLEKDNFKFRRISNKKEGSETHYQKMQSNIQETYNAPIEDKRTIAFTIYRQFLIACNLSNYTLVFPHQDAQYKAFICKGNNGLLVKSILKSRPWWVLRSYSDLDSCNLVWTEWKRTKLTNSLPSEQPKYVQKRNNSKMNITLNCNKKDFITQIKSKRLKFQKITSKQCDFISKFQSSPYIDNYFKIGPKINSINFEQQARKVFNKNEFRFSPVQKDRKILNHVPGCLQLHSKKILFINIKKYYQLLNKNIYDIVPLTFLIKNGPQDPQFQAFTQEFERLNQQKLKSKAGKIQNVWICKPGQNSNRGNGITVSSNLGQIRSLAMQKCTSTRTLLIQKYIENPYLYNRRKFDIRCYILITTINGIVKGYWYEEGYIRTTSKQYNLKHLENKFIHLTNDAIQKKGEEYGKFESCNKVSFADFQKYVEANSASQGLKFQNAYQQIKSIATDLIYSVAHKLNPLRKQYTFQLFGLDFMLDDKLKPYLIEANSNPCLEVDGNVLRKVIPNLIENVIKVAIDPIFPPPYSQNYKNRYLPQNSFDTNKMVLVYDSVRDQPREQNGDNQKQNFEEEIEDLEGDLQQ